MAETRNTESEMVGLGAAPLSMEGTTADARCGSFGPPAQCVFVIGHEGGHEWSLREYEANRALAALHDENDALRASLSSSRRELEEARHEATRWRELLELTVAARNAGDAWNSPSGDVCKTHGFAVLVTHVNDGEPCSDYLRASRSTSDPETT